MRKMGVVAACILGLVVLVLAAFGVQNARINVEAVCQIERLGGGQGSGTLVASNSHEALILTCRHVAAKVGERVTITWLATGQQCEGTVLDVVTDTPGLESDLAFIRSAIPSRITPVSIGTFDPKNGPFTTVGYRDRELYISIARTASEFEGRIRLSAPLMFGMSGGPCFDRYGHLVGVGVATSLTEGVAANGKYLKELVDKYKWAN